MKSIVKSKSNDQISPFYQTENKFNVKNDKNFLVLPGGKTIVGVNPKSLDTLNTLNALIVEDITTGKVASFGKHRGDINTLLYDEGTGSLFAGNSRGGIVQYKRSSSHSNFSLLKDYGDVGTRGVYSFAQVGRFAVFGCCKYSLVAIDILERRLCITKITSPFDNTFTLQVCQGLSNKVYLSIGGFFPKYSSRVSDLLDVTRVYKKQEGSIKMAEKHLKSKKGVEKVCKKYYKDPQ